ncbi:MAG TPA: zf-HC2 domain-containing protein [Blastocatellia bacterium]|nr:zf-HC2 domain-containing protein [Blastocatellia bacterium]
MTSSKTDQIHVSWEEIGRYVSGTLPEWERALTETHLAGCGFCRGNLVIKIKSLPFQPLTPDGRPQLPGMTAATLRCGWSRLIGPYLAGRMAHLERERLEEHLVLCEPCRCHLGIYLQSMTSSQNFSLFHRVRQWLKKCGLFRRCRREERDGRGEAPSVL